MLVRDQAVLDLLPALFKPAQQRKTPAQQVASQIKELETELEKIGDTNQDRSTAIKAQIATLRETLKSLTQPILQDADAAAANDANAKPLKQAPIKKAPGK